MLFKLRAIHGSVHLNFSPNKFPCRVGIHASHVEVRFQDLNVETDVFVGSRALPSVSNAFLNYLQVRLHLHCLWY